MKGSKVPRMTKRHMIMVRDDAGAEHHHGVDRDDDGRRHHHRHDREQDHSTGRAGENTDEGGDK